MPVPEGWSAAHARHRDRIAKALERTKAAKEGKINPWAVATAQEEESMGGESGEHKEEPEKKD